MMGTLKPVNTYSEPNTSNVCTIISHYTQPHFLKKKQQVLFSQKYTHSAIYAVVHACSYDKKHPLCKNHCMCTDVELD